MVHFSFMTLFFSVNVCDCADFFSSFVVCFCAPSLPFQSTVRFDSLCPINNLSFIKGRVFLG